MRVLLDMHCWLWLCVDPGRFVENLPVLTADRGFPKYDVELLKP